MPGTPASRCSVHSSVITVRAMFFFLATVHLGTLRASAAAPRPDEPGHGRVRRPGQLARPASPGNRRPPRRGWPPDDPRRGSVRLLLARLVALAGLGATVAHAVAGL